MGNVFSTDSTRAGSSADLTSESETMSDTNASPDVGNMEQIDGDSSNVDDERAKAKEQEMTEFRTQLNVKREQRKEILYRHKKEKMELEKSLHNERKARLDLVETNRLLRVLLENNNISIPENLQSATHNSEIMDTIARMTEEFEELKTNNNKLRRDLTESNSALQNAYSDIADLNAQHTESIKQIHALKEVVTVSKTMINLREKQLNDLKDKLNEIEVSLADRETNLLSADLRQEYSRQLQNIRTLRGLYEERARLAEVTRQGLVRDLDEQKLLYQAEVTKCKDLSSQVKNLEDKVEGLQDLLDRKDQQISTYQNEKNGLKSEMEVVNKLFSQVLLGYKTKQDLDQLVQRLEENHGLLTHMAEREDDSEASSALPKLLLELVSQVEDIEHRDEDAKDESEATLIDKKDTEVPNVPGPVNTTAEEIVENLPKVWRVLMELLSHQSVVEGNPSEKVTTCYKSVETKSGPVLVPSVSQTYIRLKDLIIEKLGLIKEVNRMKQLNTHLETRLGEQERRLCLVTNELTKTWHVVGRLRRHHHQLHTHEKILKYELQQKRKLLNELKEELEYCREKWEQAREKNTQSEKDWKKLRAEFSTRKLKSDSPSFNNSGESGYSDEKQSDESSESNDESGFVAEKLHRCKKKMKVSFETILDSSTDLNLAAEREDPASDMLDVADLPLDTQDCDDNQETASVSLNSEHLPANESICIETEDEVCEIVNDESTAKEKPDSQCVESTFFDTGTSSNNEESTKSTLLDPTTVSESRTLIDPAVILNNVKLQNERLAKKDERLEQLEKSSAALLKKSQGAAECGHKLNNILDQLINRPKSIRKLSVDAQSNEDQIQATSEDAEENIEIAECVNQVESSDNGINLERTEMLSNEAESHPSEETIQQRDYLELNSNSITKNTSSAGLTIVPVVDFKAIIESVKQQDQRLAIKDARLEQLEAGCSDVVQKISNTLATSETIAEKIDDLHKEYEKEKSPLTDTDDAEPSTSSELDHEARFAARDLRLKRLEEQTKSLVNSVNKTNSKGVKIHYKLEELHNIYGSENSRAGTPSDDVDETNIADEPTEE